jgi:hypothetical protein
MSLHPDTEPILDLQLVSALTPEDIDWFWLYRLAFGKLAILDGDPGLGKSLLTLDLCARLSTGRPFPDGAPGTGPASAIILNAEDSARDTIHPRLVAAGADIARVTIFNLKTAAGRRLPVGFPAHTDFLRRALEQTGARLVVVDPIMAFFDRTVLISNDQSVRRALYPLVQLADDYRCLVLLVRHLNKSLRVQALYRGGGSIGLVGACRSAWLVAPDPGDPQRRLLAQVKNNLAVPQPTLTYAVDAPGTAQARLTWQRPSPWTADQVLATAAKMAPRIRLLELAREFLLEALKDGPRTSRELWALAQVRRLRRRTLRRAKLDLQIRSVRVWADGKRLSYWLLPGQQLPAGTLAETNVPDLEEYLAPLREQFPLATPLDEL